MAKATPEKSAGARAERKAFRAYLRRIKPSETMTAQMLLEAVFEWVNKRSKRYNDPRHPGGLGK